ncbi:hypothetical protein RI367_005302 [Sorochytrium milnesiophthora]
MASWNLKLAVALLVVLLFLPAIYSKDSNITAQTEEVKRRVYLPHNVRPSHYDLTLRPDLENFTFTGVEEITVAVLEETDTIVLNAIDLDVKSATIVFGQGTYDSAAPTYNKDEQTVTFKFPVYVSKGQTLVLRVVFEGVLNDQMVGFYRSGYEVDGEKKYMAVTQFEPADCRRAIPSFDEVHFVACRLCVRLSNPKLQPALKATFNVTLIVAKHLTALSNCEVVSNEVDVSDEGKRVVKFARTPVMSSYLLAFAVGEFEYIEDHTNVTAYLPKSVKVRVYTTKGLSHQGRFALGVAVRALEYFSEIFGIPYLLSKCDHIAVPDLKFSRMGNWGLHTYRPSALLIDDITTRLRLYKTFIAPAITHELAHQWFGNLVTLQNWDELWLKEGFATWAGILGVSQLFPEWDVWSQFLVEDQYRALKEDGLRVAHPMHVDGLGPKEAMKAMTRHNEILYSKSASVIHMLNNWLGPDIFLKGIRQYLTKHQYSNVIASDLWDALAQVSGQDVRSFMNRWITVIGYPVLKVNERPGPSGKRSLHLSQQRYLSTGDVKPDEDTTVWPLPLNIAAAVKKEDDREVFTIISKEVLTERTTTIELDIDDAEAPFLFNFEHSSYYRVAYSEEALRHLSAVIKRGAVGVRNRLGLYGDAYDLARAGFQRTSCFLALITDGLTSETEYAVFESAASYLVSICDTWAGRSPEVDVKLNALRRQVFAPHAHKITFAPQQSDTPLSEALRPLVIGQAGYGGDKRTVDGALKLYEKLIKNDTSAVTSGMYGTVLGITVANGGEAEFNQTVRLFETTQDDYVRYGALSALGHTNKPELIQRLLEYSLSESVRWADIYYPWITLSANHYARQALWKFFTANWDLLSVRYTADSDNLCWLVQLSTHSFTTQADLDAMHQFFAGKETRACRSEIDQSADDISGRVNWLKRDGKFVDAWLLKNVR